MLDVVVASTLTVANWPHCAVDNSALAPMDCTFEELRTIKQRQFVRFMCWTCAVRNGVTATVTATDAVQELV